MNKFNHISQRVLFAYQIAFSDFLPIASDQISREAQRHLYELMRDLQDKLYRSPELLGLPMESASVAAAASIVPKAAKIKCLR